MFLRRRIRWRGSLRIRPALATILIPAKPYTTSVLVQPCNIYADLNTAQNSKKFAKNGKQRRRKRRHNAKPTRSVSALPTAGTTRATARRLPSTVMFGLPCRLLPWPHHRHNCRQLAMLQRAARRRRMANKALPWKACLRTCPAVSAHCPVLTFCCSYPQSPYGQNNQHMYQQR